MAVTTRYDDIGGYDDELISAKMLVFRTFLKNEIRQNLDDVQTDITYTTDANVINNLVHGFHVGSCALFFYHVYRGITA